MKVSIEIVARPGVMLLPFDYHKLLLSGERTFRQRVAAYDRSPPQTTPDGGLRQTHQFRLEFFLPGDFALPPATVSFTPPAGAAPDDEPPPVQTLSTELIRLVVEPTDEFLAAANDPTKIHRLEPVELPERTHPWRWVLGVGAVLVAAAAAVLLLRRRRKRLEAALDIPAHEWALRELAALIAENLPAKRALQEFYYGVSSIVRGYVERRFGVSAPEMTTEEFLSAAARDSRFGRETTEELRRFLTACDLVKYARHEPPYDECEAVLRAAHDFVEKTRADRPQHATAQSAGTGERMT